MNEVKVERYLRRATRGLWGRKREEVREELEAHIQERVVAHRITGLSEESAVERTLSEMGEPKEVREGMTRIYTLPTLLGSGAFFTAVCAVIAVTFSDGLAQSLPLDYRWPAEICLEASAQSLPEKCKTDVPWLSVRELEENLEPLGVSVAEQEGGVTLTFPNAQPVRLPPLDINPADYYNPSGDTLNSLVRSEQLRKGYYPLYEILFEIASQADVPVKLSGWEAPELQVGNTAFQLGTEARALKGDLFRFGLLFWPLVEQPSFPEFLESVELIYTAWDDGDGSSKYDFGSQRFEVGAEEDTYGYFLAAWLEPTPGDTILWYDAVRANGDGVIDLRIPDNVTFVDQVDEQPALNTAVLVRLEHTFTTYDVATEREGYEVAGLAYDIVSPAQIRAAEEAQ